MSSPTGNQAGGSPGIVANTASADVQIQAETKTPGSVHPGETIHYTLTASANPDAKQLEKIVSRIRGIAGVKDVVRKYNVAKAGERE